MIAWPKDSNFSFGLIHSLARGFFHIVFSVTIIRPSLVQHFYRTLASRPPTHHPQPIQMVKKRRGRWSRCDFFFFPFFCCCFLFEKNISLKHFKLPIKKHKKQIMQNASRSRKSKNQKIKKSKNQKIKKIKTIQSINGRVWRQTTILLFPQKCLRAELIQPWHAW